MIIKQGIVGDGIPDVPQRVDKPIDTLAGCEKGRHGFYRKNTN